MSSQLQSRANRVREFRVALSLSTTQLANAAGVTRQSIWLIETGKMKPSVTVALRIAKSFNMRVAEIFDMGDESTPAPLAISDAVTGDYIPPSPPEPPQAVSDAIRMGYTNPRIVTIDKAETIDHPTACDAETASTQAQPHVLMMAEELWSVGIALPPLHAMKPRSV